MTKINTEAYQEALRRAVSAPEVQDVLASTALGILNDMLNGEGTEFTVKKMKCMGYATYPIIRRHVRGGVDELADVLNRESQYIFKKLNHPIEKPFTENEKRLLLQWLGYRDTEENRQKVFEDWKPAYLEWLKNQDVA